MTRGAQDHSVLVFRWTSGGPIMNSAPTKSNRGHATWIVLVLALAAVAATHGDRQPVDWRTRLANELPLLGHRNWIVIADAAYPWQTAEGIETVNTDAEQLDVAKTVLTELAKVKHV